ncbi:MAG: hypothetical protein ACLRTA_08530 [Clostridia bacterium]
MGDSKYNERRSECGAALAELQQVIGIESLGSVGGQFETYKSASRIPSEQSARHAAGENQRTIKAVAALKANYHRVWQADECVPRFPAG